MKIKLFSKSYIDWEEYQHKISVINWLRFLTNISIENHRNTLEKAKRGDKYEF